MVYPVRGLMKGRESRRNHDFVFLVEQHVMSVGWPVVAEGLGTKLLAGCHVLVGPDMDPPAQAAKFSPHAGEQSRVFLPERDAFTP